MTVSTTANKITYNGDGATINFPYTFANPATSDIVVYYTDSSGNITNVTSSCTITINAATGTNPTPVGGTVTYQRSGSPITVGTLLTIYRSLSEVQSTSFANQGTLYQPVIEQAFDYIMMVSQQLQELIGRGIVVSVSDPTPTALPPVAQRASQWMAFDASGNPIAASAPSGGVPISTAMQPVVNAATLPLARTAMGLGAMATEGIGAGLQDDGSGNARYNSATVLDTTNQSVTSAFHQTTRVATGPITYTLPRANTLWNGFEFFIYAQTGLITLACNINDAFGNATSGQSFFVQPGSFVRIKGDANVAGIWYVDSHLVGPAIASGATIINGYFTATQNSPSANQLTVAVKTFAGNDPSNDDPAFVVFRSSTAASGAVSIVPIFGPLSITIPSGATFNFSNSTSARIWVVALNNGGAVELALMNAFTLTSSLLTFYPLSAWGLITSATIAISNSSNSSQTFYSINSRNNVAYTVLGYMTWESGLTSAGSWNAAPTRTQMFRLGDRLPGEVVQHQSYQNTSYDSTANNWTPSNTAPVAANGKAYASIAFTPTSGASILRIKAGACGAASTSTAIFLCFVTSSSGPTTLATSNPGATLAGGNIFQMPTLQWRGFTGNTSTFTYTAYFSTNSGTAYLNGISSGAQGGNTFVSYLEIEELMG